MIIGGIFILGMVCAGVEYGFGRTLDLFCVGAAIAGVSLMLYYGFVLQ